MRWISLIALSLLACCKEPMSSSICSANAAPPLRLASNTPGTGVVASKERPDVAARRARVFWNFLQNSYACIRWSDGSSTEVPSGYGLASSNPDAVPIEALVWRDENDKGPPVKKDVAGAVGRCPRNCHWVLGRRGVMEASPEEAFAAYRFFPTRGRVRSVSQKPDCPEVGDSLEPIRPWIQFFAPGADYGTFYLPRDYDP